MGVGSVSGRQMGARNGGNVSERPTLTIGMAVYDNFDEVFFTVQSLRFHHQEVIDRFEIVIVDNNPGTLDGVAVKKLIEGRVREKGRYIEFPTPKGSCPPRQHLFDKARGDWVVCIDSHVMFESGALAKLVEYIDNNPHSDDLLHGPLVSNYGPHRLEATQMFPRWRSEMFGTWMVDERGKDPDGEPFEIDQHGLGFFCARRVSWLRFPENLRGFSGGEGYIHHKYRSHGRRVLCLPGVRWIHKFSRPHGIPHRPNREDKIKNHVRGWMDLGVDLQTGNTDDPLASMARHYISTNKLTAPHFEKLVSDAGYPGYKVSDKASTRGIVLGPCSFGSYRLRGRPVVERCGLEEGNTRARVRLERTYDVALVVKADIPEVVRQKAKRVIWEPLDIWFDRRREAEMNAAEWLRAKHLQFKFDEIIVSTIPMEIAAREVLRGYGVRVHLVPHHADPRVGLDWYDPNGPIVYAGHSYFIKGFEKSIERAAARIGRQCKLATRTHSWKALEGAALVLAPRLASRHPMNLTCKPVIKLANASQAGIPALATPDTATATLFFDVSTLRYDRWNDEKELSEAMAAALRSKPSDVKFDKVRWLDRMQKIIDDQ